MTATKWFPPIPGSSWFFGLFLTTLEFVLGKKGCEKSIKNFRYKDGMMCATDTLMQIPNEYVGCEYISLVFCRINGWLLDNMDKKDSVPKWELLVWLEIPQN